MTSITVTYHQLPLWATVAIYVGIVAVLVVIVLVLRRGLRRPWSSTAVTAIQATHHGA